jgi:hypothetical protein
MSGLVHRWVQNQYRHWCWGIQKRLKRVNSFSFGLYTTVLQTEIYAIKAWDSGEYRKAVYRISWPLKPLTVSKLFWDCHQSLIKLANQYTIQLVWVP